MQYYIVINCHKFMLKKNRTTLTSLRNIISVILWWSVLLVDETRVHGENHRHATDTL
jgi:hypothetical protein